MVIKKRIMSFLLAFAVLFSISCGFFVSAMGDEETSETPDITLEDEVYEKENLTDYIQWDGVAKLLPGKNYYIGTKAKLTKTLTIPETTTLLVPENTIFLIYSNGKLINKGKLIIEKNAQVTVSGTVFFSTNSTTSIFGQLSLSKSSSAYFKSIVAIRKSGAIKASGIVTLYKNGQILNYGQINLTPSSTFTLTGEIISTINGKTIISSKNAKITLSGRLTAAGYFNIAKGASITNSGIVIFEKTIKYYKSGTITATRSSKLIDYRYRVLTEENYDNQEDEPVDNTGTEDFDETIPVSLKGIDISYHQGAIDWAKVKKSGIEFVMIRSSRGYISDTKPMIADTMFATNIKGALDAGLKVGVYHYSYAHTVKEAQAEAKFFLETIKGYDITYPIVLDLEEESQSALGKKKLTDMAVAFLEIVDAAGYYPMIYSNKYWLTTYLDMTRLSKYDVWLAQWSSAPTYSGNFGIWQYSATGVVSGINGYTDLNISYRDYDKIIKKYGYNNYQQLRNPSSYTA